MSAAALAWIVGPDTGISSKAIFSHMMIGSLVEYGHPYDNDDLGRCLRLLEAVPEWSARIGEMAQYSPEWAALCAEWDALRALYQMDRRSKTLYETMRRLLDNARVCLDCGIVAPCAWSIYYAEGRRIRCSDCAKSHDRARTLATVRIGNVTVSGGAA